jgi:H+-transporting ATPase
MPEGPETKTDFQNLALSEVLQLLKTHPNEGLSTSEAAQKALEFGYNEVPDKKPNALLNFLKKFWGLTAWMLEAVVILSAILHKYIDLYVILALLLLNAILGFFQEQRASQAVETLKQKLRINARTLRNGTWQLLPARELVPGDVVRIRAGDFVPADLKLMEGHLQVDQAALTGESLAVEKKDSDVIFSGSIVQSGEATGVVVLTGNKTYFGKTTELVQVAKPKLHMEEVIQQVVTWLLIIVGSTLALAFVVAVFTKIDLLEVLSLTLVLLASSIPVALPAMFTISLAIGSLELVRRGVLVTRLSAAEDAATMDTLCTDKTGTITMNKLSVAGVISLGDAQENDVLLYAALASQEANHDPIDLAFLSAAQERGLKTQDYIPTSFIPFDPKTRRTEALLKKGTTNLRVVKGAVNALAELCGQDAQVLNERAHDYAEKGFRTLAVAFGEGSQLKIAGLVALYDKPRPDAGVLISKLQNLGISVKMLTGDALPIARETARQVGLSDAITSSVEFEGTLAKDPDKAGEIAEKSDGFAEIYPEDKFHIVQSLQKRGHVVGMTGDGLNDAPSLKQAEVGIAVSSATDVAKGAASAVLTGDGLANIVDLVQVGRMIYQRILTWIFNKVVKTFQIVVFVVAAFLLTGKFVVSAFDVVLLLFVIDFVTLSISTDNARWSQTPDTWDISSLVRTSAVIGVLVVLESLAILWVGMSVFHLTGAVLRTYSFSILFYFGLLSVFVVRERGHFWNSAPSKPLFWISLADMILVAVLVTLGLPGVHALPLQATLTVLGMSAVFSFALNDFVKYGLLKLQKHPALKKA